MSVLNNHFDTLFTLNKPSFYCVIFDQTSDFLSLHDSNEPANISKKEAEFSTCVTFCKEIKDTSPCWAHAWVSWWRLGHVYCCTLNLSHFVFLFFDVCQTVHLFQVLNIDTILLHLSACHTLVITFSISVECAFLLDNLTM